MTWLKPCPSEIENKTSRNKVKVNDPTLSLRDEDGAPGGIGN
jgi:hypothetical protein